MLLIADCVEPSVDIDAATSVVSLETSKEAAIGYTTNGCYKTLKCDVALRGFADAARLREAILRYRYDPSMPLIMVVERGDALAYALANMLGADQIVTRGSKASGVYGAPREVQHCPAEATPSTEGVVPLSALVQAVETSLRELFDVSHKHKQIQHETLVGGADALVVAIKQHGIGEFLELVRSYDDITFQHCLLVAGLVTAFAGRRGMSGASQHLLAQAALVHDIGKARVPLAILNKPGPLTDAEMAVMRRHPATGYYMIAHHGALDPRILDIVRHHHECVDGTGYPDGLRGSQVSEFCRIVTICDIFGALIERRAYKDPTPPAAAYEILLNMGKKLDRGLLTEFAALVDEITTHAAPAAVARDRAASVPIATQAVRSKST